MILNVDKNQIAVMGFAFGGIQTMLAVECGPGYRVDVNCSGAAEVWRDSSALRSRLIAAASKPTMPAFFLQAGNDHELTPNRILSQEVRKTGQQVEAGPSKGHRSGFLTSLDSLRRISDRQERNRSR